MIEAGEAKELDSRSVYNAGPGSKRTNNALVMEHQPLGYVAILISTTDTGIQI